MKEISYFFFLLIKVETTAMAVIIPNKLKDVSSVGGGGGGLSGSNGSYPFSTSYPSE